MYFVGDFKGGVYFLGGGALALSFSSERRFIHSVLIGE